jgi:nucleoside triphosphate pyrophosphatase
MGLWLAAEPLVLASRSASRRAVLVGAGIPVEAEPADVNERSIEASAIDKSPTAVATLLARAKALAVAARRPGRLVLGADQTLSLGERLFTKPADLAAARAQLTSLRGATHALHSGLALARDGAVVREHCEIATLTMRNFSDRFLDAYIEAVGLAVTASVGGYQVEGSGIQLFERIEGDHFTILGLPLLPLLAYLRREGYLAA